MIRLFARGRIPAELRPSLDREERILAWSAVTDGGAVVVTNHGLWLAGRRTGWHEISKAVWDGAVLTVTATESVGEQDGAILMRDLPPVRIVPESPGDVPQLVRQRVTASIVSSDPQPDGSRLVGRRVPGVDGIAWMRHLPG